MYICMLQLDSTTHCSVAPPIIVAIFYPLNQLCIYIYIYIHIYTYIYTSLSLYIYIYREREMYTYIYIYIYTHIHTYMYVCVPFQPILWNKYFPPEPAKTAKHSPKSISEGGRIWQVCRCFTWCSSTLLSTSCVQGNLKQSLCYIRVSSLTTAVQAHKATSCAMTRNTSQRDGIQRDDVFAM